MIGDRLWKYRCEMGYSRKQLARKLGVHVDTIQRWELNKREPKVTHLELLADIYGVSVGDFFNKAAPIVVPDNVTEPRQGGWRMRRVTDNE